MLSLKGSLETMGKTQLQYLRAANVPLKLQQ